ncbi:hypothetical protein [Asaia prunellae]|uniref:hypothetical protein n=1 Tax=Asaia prunellae TaxID=610245 RepID=UPI001900AB40|nr:hypothetical protein [Asaia prunellae]
MDRANDHKLSQSMPEDCVFDFIDHIDDWLEYLTKVLELSKDDWKTCIKYKRQIEYLIRFRQGDNSNINHNRLLYHYYSNKSSQEATTSDSTGSMPVASTASRAKKLRRRSKRSLPKHIR